MSKRNLLLLSNSTLHGSGYLEWASEHIKSFLSRKNVSKVLFIPYALTDQDDYTNTVEKAFKQWGFTVQGIHQSSDPIASVKSAEAVFIGGGNTFRLLNKLYTNDLITVIRDRVLKDGMPYIGSSAGTNVATVSICTTNDMPIVFPPSFDGLKLVPFNINPHFIEAKEGETHMGESRTTRINQYHEEESSSPVLALREGCLLLVEGDTAIVAGKYGAKFFQRGSKPAEYSTGDVSFLLTDATNIK